MRIAGVEAIWKSREIKVRDGRMLLVGTVEMALDLPAQDADLPGRLETAVEDAGQELKRQLFRAVIERADREAVLAARGGKDDAGIQQRGTAGYTFKSVFGTVRVRRGCISHRADGTREIPSAAAWRTPRQVCITPGLENAACDAFGERSARGTVEQLEQRAGEEGLLEYGTVLNLVHEQGNRLRRAQSARAESALAADAAAAAALLPAPPVAEADEPAAGDDSAEGGPGGDEAEEPDPLPFTGFPGAPPAAAAADDDPAGDDPARRVDPDCVHVQADEVKVQAQHGTGRKELLVYTAVVMTSVAVVYFSAADAGQLQLQVAGCLAALGVHRGDRRLLFVADGAKWIRDWFEGLQVPSAMMVLCWYHLAKKCGQLLSMACRGSDHRRAVLHELLGPLWEGRVDDALAVLAARRGGFKNLAAADELVGYLEARRPYLPNYKDRQRAGLWIASNRVEKFNDWAVSERCKGRGMEWTVAGVNAVAALEAARRNRELEMWRATDQLLPTEALLAA